MFVLETPGRDNRNLFEDVTFGGSTKAVPTKGYYWMPNNSPQGWPDAVGSGEYYGTYFAYLLKKFRLTRAYFTNLRKCRFPSLTEEKKDNINENCYQVFLCEELEIWRPVVIFAFGKRVYQFLQSRDPDLHDCHRFIPHIERLRHPAYRRYNPNADVISWNDERIYSALKMFAATLE